MSRVVGRLRSSAVAIAASAACAFSLLSVSRAQSITANPWGDAQPELPAAHQASLLQPFWVGSRMSNEPLFFLQAPNESLATARLLFVPTTILSLSSVNGGTSFVEGKDYTWQRGTNLLTLTPGSRIPFKTWAEMHPPIGSPHSLGKAPGGKTSLYFVENSPIFQNLQPLATYEHDAQWTGHIPPSGAAELARTMARLKARQPVNIVVLGDSVSTGAGASSLFHEFPYQPGYVDILADGLRLRYGAEVSTTNLSEGGQDTAWGVTKTAEVIAAKPDLVILSFGGNDGSRRFTPEAYAQNNQKMVSAIRAALPQADIILIATMGANPEWDASAFPLYPLYLDALNRMKQPGIAVADLTTVWGDMLKIKKFYDLTMNGINHPNDFGQRVYAHVLLQLMQ